MKTTPKSLFLLLFTTLLLVGCQQEEAEAVAPSIPSLYGHWKMTAYADIWDVLPPNQTIATGSDTGSLQFWFHPDSTYRLLSTHSNIISDTGRYFTGAGLLWLETVNPNPVVSVLISSRYSFDAGGRLLLNFPEYAQYPLNDTGATPVLGDFAFVVHTYTFTKQ